MSVQTTKEIVTWLVDELTKAVEAQVTERLRVAMSAVLGNDADAPSPRAAIPRRRNGNRHARDVIDQRKTWTLQQLVRAGGAKSRGAASASLRLLAKQGRVRVISRGYYEVIEPMAADRATPNGVHTGA